MNKKFYFAVFIVMVVLFGCSKKENVQVQEELTQEAPAVETASTTDLNQTTGLIDMGAPIESAAVDVSNTPEQAVFLEAPEKTNENIQVALKNAGLYEGDIDGKIGPKTKKAIEEFQRQNDLKVDGVVGPKTWERLSSYFNAAPAIPAQVEVVTVKTKS